MKSTAEQFKSLKENLIKKGETAEFFTRKTLDIILNDRITAAEIMLNGGNIQEFYRGSETAKTETSGFLKLKIKSRLVLHLR